MSDDVFGFDAAGEQESGSEAEGAAPAAATGTKGRKKRKTPNAPKPLSITPKKVSFPEPEERSYYLCGLLPDCPFGSISFGGIDFSKWEQSQVPREGDPTRTILSAPMQVSGRVHHLTDVQKEAVLEGVAKKVIRSAGTQKTLRSMDGSRYRDFRPVAGDEPVATYVYMVEIESPTLVDRTYPPAYPPLLKR